jgi:NAD(P)-dependent dehydrogenase (short-subunit alcohol dehydrogenase family)
MAQQKEAKAMTRLLENKNAIVYGAGGDIGGGVARTFAREGATVFLVGRTKQPLEAVAAAIKAEGGVAEGAVLDALDERAVEGHVGRVSKGGSVDVSFNLITRGDVQQIPLVEMTGDDLIRAVTKGLKTNFITARAAARHMIKQGSGVILHLNSGSARGATPMMGSTGPADAATETFMRYLAAEIGQFGVRVVGLYTAGVADALTREKLAKVGGGGGIDPADVERAIAGMAMLRRAPRLAQVADTAAFLASDRAAGITGTIVNVTCGLLPG